MNNDLENAKKVFEERARNPEDSSCEIDLTHPLTPQQVLEIIEAHTEFEKRMNTDSYLTLKGPMTVEEIKLAVDKMRQQHKEQ